ncbi:hypothetical protein Tco_1257461 [Tanacetum coccineum]
MSTPKLLNLPHKLRIFPKEKSLELKVDSEENNLQNTHLRHPNPKLANQKKKLSPGTLVKKEPTLSSVVVCLHLILTELVLFSFFHLHYEFASRHDALVDSIAEADPGLSAPNNSIPSQQGTNEESRADEISKKIKLEDLLDLFKDTRSAFFTPDSPQDELIIVSNESEEEKEVAKDKDTHASSHDVPEDTSIPHPPSPKSA